MGPYRRIAEAIKRASGLTYRQALDAVRGRQHLASRKDGCLVRSAIAALPAHARGLVRLGEGEPTPCPCRVCTG
jgi:hypothetical protein